MNLRVDFKFCISGFISACAGVLLTTGITSSGFAADLYAPRPVAAAPSWTGCYVGVHTGGALSDDKIRSSSDFNSTGFVAGGQLGCDYQFWSGWVAGVGGKAAWSSLTSHTPGRGIETGVEFPTQFTVDNDFLASATARVGHTFGDNWLAYVDGGFAWTREKFNIAYIQPPTGAAVDPSGTNVRSGWTTGAGLEWAFAPHWSTNIEYNYYNFGTNAFLPTQASPPASFIGYLTDTIHTVTVGVNYRF
jgi:outer membrane immunogenic protein